MFEETSAHINLVNKVQMQFWLLQSPFSVFQSLFYGRYFPLYNPPWTILPLHLFVIQAITWVFVPSNFLLSFFLSCDLPGNTVQKSTPHKCSHKSRYNAFNVEVTAFLKIFWSLPSSQCVCEAFLCGENFVENHYNGPSKQLNRIQ